MSEHQPDSSWPMKLSASSSPHLYFFCALLVDIDGVRFLSLADSHRATSDTQLAPKPNIIFALILDSIRVHSSAVVAADCRSAGPWFDSRCALNLCSIAALWWLPRLPVRTAHLTHNNRYTLCFYAHLWSSGYDVSLTR